MSSSSSSSIEYFVFLIPMRSCLSDVELIVALPLLLLLVPLVAMVSGFVSGLDDVDDIDEVDDDLMSATGELGSDTEVGETVSIRVDNRLLFLSSVEVVGDVTVPDLVVVESRLVCWCCVVTVFVVVEPSDLLTVVVVCFSIDTQQFNVP